ncbi:MAG TPA: long-chain fatty acid--CoA ligase [Thermodesulfobacteriota bacterium]|nr:long-chain fatty acid--CoA ligase [Thermodesulfobacteriota bacterium]
MNIADFIKARAKEFGNKIFLWEKKNSLTYKEFDQVTDRLAAGLQSLGLKKQDHAAVLFPNSMDTLLSYFSVIKAGGTAIPINPLYTPREIAFILNNSESQFLLAAQQFQKAIAEIHPQIPGLKRNIFGGEGEPSIMKALARLAPSAGSLNPVDLSSDDPAIIFYTSGTLGTPKGVMLTHGNFTFSGPNIARCYGLREDDITMAVLPLVHVFAVASPVFGSLSSGGRVVILDRFQTESVLQAFVDYRVTWFPGVPTMFNYLCHAYETGSYNVSSIRMGLSGGASLSVELLKNWENRFSAEILEVYGLTESTGLVTANPVHGVRKAGSIGIAVPHVQTRLIDPEGKDVAGGEVGELLFKGPNATKGYWKLPEQTAESIREGWVYTGDLARQDRDGYFYIVGRKKDLIIVGGYNVYPREVEEVLYTHPSVYESAVIGIPDEMRGEVPKAFITLKPGQETSEEEIIDFCKQNLAPYKIPRQVEIRSELPKSSTGKILHRELRKE